MSRLDEQLSAEFHRWEVRGRGWQIYPQPVYPEPPFVPFDGHYLPSAPVIDDGRRPTFLSSLVQKLSKGLSTEKPKTPIEPEPEEEPEPTPLIRGPLTELQLALPSDFDADGHSLAQFFESVSLCREPLTFELLGVRGRVVAQFAMSKADAPTVALQLKSHFPGVTVREQENTLPKTWDSVNGGFGFAVEFGLGKEFMLPLAIPKGDPFVGIIGALAELQANELGLFQVLWQPVQNPWANEILDSAVDSNGKPFFVNAPELAKAAEQKVSRPLFAVVVRILARTETEQRLSSIARNLAASLRVFSNPQGNHLIPLRLEEYDLKEHVEDMLRRQTRRSGMILNGDELAGFVHLPSSTVQTPALLRDTGLTKSAPDIVRQSSGIVIGDNEHNGDSVSVYLTADQRVRHTHIIGSSGTGKSSLLFNLIQQDIENGDGLAVLDPHGDLINQILSIIPDSRMDDVVLVDPSDTEFPVGFNILSAHSDEEKNLLASDLIAVFRRLSTSWGDQMDTVLQNAILAFLESKQGGTLLELRLFLLDAKYRRQFLQTVSDPEIIFYWQNVFPQLTGGKSIGPVLTRLQDFFSRKPLRNMVGQLENKLDFADIMDSGKIFLARLPEGCGEENSYLLGTLLVSKFQQLAMARQSQSAANRRNFWLYIDEFDHFITPSMAKILSAVRKYRLGFTLAHQELHQLQDDLKVASAVMTQPCTRIVFNVGDDDAKKLGEGFESFDAKSLKKLPKFHAIARVERNDCDFNLAIRKPELPNEDEAAGQREKVIAASRAKYATPRAGVEAKLLARAWGDKAGAPPVIVEPPKVIAPSPAPVAPLITVSEKEEVAAATAPVATPPPPTVKPKTTATSSDASKDAGRGGARHKSIQKRIKAAAEKLGFSAEIEKQLSPGLMQAADLVLRRGHVAIAVEITVTTTVDHEFGNVKKCLEAGFSRVAVVSTGRKHLEAIAVAVQGGLGPEAAAKVSYHTPDEFLDELRKLAATSELPPAAMPLPATETIDGFEVERNFPQQSTTEQKATQQGIHEVVTKIINLPSNNH